MQRRPFVYIAALRRTGSTLLAECLTRPPHALILREPHFGRNRVGVKAIERAMLTEYAPSIRHRLDAAMQSASHNTLPGHILDTLNEAWMCETTQPSIAQLGVKEIRHGGWKRYTERFDDVRFVVTARDPRDIYVSIGHRSRTRRGAWRTMLTPHTLADDLMREFDRQRAIIDAHPTVRVRYEDLCAAPNLVLERIRSFVASPLPGVGDIGCYLSRSKRHDEARLHGPGITAQRVRRWKLEADKQLHDEAQACFELLDDYVSFWDYSASGEEGPVPAARRAMSMASSSACS